MILRTAASNTGSRSTLTPDTLVSLLDSVCDKLWLVEFSCNSKGYVRITTIMEPDRD